MELEQEAALTQCTTAFGNSVGHRASNVCSSDDIGGHFPLHWFLFGRTSRLGQNLWAMGWMMALLGLGNVTGGNGL